ncbi:MAG: efflux RND transporter periplasmic adaptor subunit [Verrucomicrobiales bacterium]|nr:efflux RND transporter periplasmic adaptor subunit [Verrucomicrobiales bacterium]MCP5526393.1 efflux RND transporter periplasmic adaptor subunit [Verrucomicrobiales bacterium]
MNKGLWMWITALAGAVGVWILLRQALSGSDFDPAPGVGTRIKSGRAGTNTPPHRVIAEGRVVAYPGSEVAVGAEISGILVSVSVAEKSAVQQGEVLAVIDSQLLEAEVAEAEALATAREAELAWARRMLERRTQLAGRNAATPEDLDTAQLDLELALARTRAAEAHVDLVRTKLAKTSIAAPLAGVVIQRHRDAGEIVLPGDPVVTIADLNRLRIEAEVDDYDVGRVALGQEATITAEAFPGKRWSGRVEEVPDRLGEKRLRPMDPARPTDAWVLAVRITLPEGSPLRLGQRVEVELRPPPHRQ